MGWRRIESLRVPTCDFQAEMDVWEPARVRLTLEEDQLKLKPRLWEEHPVPCPQREPYSSCRSRQGLQTDWHGDHGSEGRRDERYASLWRWGWLPDPSQQGRRRDTLRRRKIQIFRNRRWR